MLAKQIRKYVGWISILPLLAPSLAHAQVLGGGGGSFLAGLLAWIQGNVITTLGTLAIIGAGLVMLSMRASWMHIIMVCAGIWLIFNASTLIGLIST